MTRGGLSSVGNVDELQPEDAILFEGAVKERRKPENQKNRELEMKFLLFCNIFID